MIWSLCLIRRRADWTRREGAARLAALASPGAEYCQYVLGRLPAA
jgi:hypothetical protein